MMSRDFRIHPTVPSLAITFTHSIVPFRNVSSSIWILLPSEAYATIRLSYPGPSRITAPVSALTVTKTGVGEGLGVTVDVGSGVLVSVTFAVGVLSIGNRHTDASSSDIQAVSYTHLTLPTNREV